MHFFSPIARKMLSWSFHVVFHAETFLFFFLICHEFFLHEYYGLLFAFLALCRWQRAIFSLTFHVILHDVCHRLFCFNPAPAHPGRHRWNCVNWIFSSTLPDVVFYDVPFYSITDCFHLARLLLLHPCFLHLIHFANCIYCASIPAENMQHFPERSTSFSTTQLFFSLFSVAWVLLKQVQVFQCRFHILVIANCISCWPYALFSFMFHVLLHDVPFFI